MTRRAFTLVEVLLAAGIAAVLFGVLALLARDFLVGFLWSGETFSAAHEASLLHATLRRDLSRVALDSAGTALDFELVRPSGQPPTGPEDRGGGSAPRTGGAASPLTVSFGVPGANGPERLTYRFDPARRVVLRESGGQTTELGQGMVASFELSQVQLRQLEGSRYGVADRLSPGEKPFRTGLRLRLTLQGLERGPAGGAAKSLSFATHFFPVFANLRLSSQWRAVKP